MIYTNYKEARVCLLECGLKVANVGRRGDGGNELWLRYRGNVYYQLFHQQRKDYINIYPDFLHCAFSNVVSYDSSAIRTRWRIPRRALPCTVISLPISFQFSRNSQKLLQNIFKAGEKGPEKQNLSGKLFSFCYTVIITRFS